MNGQVFEANVSRFRSLFKTVQSIISVACQREFVYDAVKLRPMFRLKQALVSLQAGPPITWPACVFVPQ